MKKTWIAIAALCCGLSLNQLAIAQDGDAPAPTPEPAVESGTVHSSGTVISGSSYGGSYTGSNTAVAPVKPLKYHPAPLYANSHRGRQATNTHEWNSMQAQGLPWHGAYYNARYGAPVALVVPPTAAFMSNYSWGVGNTTSTPIYHQFNRFYPGPASGGNAGMFYPTPLWPSNTNQFGYYPVRGPW